MRKKLLFLATVAIAALASCSKTEIRPEVESRDVHFVVNTAENEEVKSFIENNHNGSYTPKWSNGDELAIFVGTINENTKTPTGVLKNTNTTGIKASFGGVVSGISLEGKFKSFAPASAFATSYSSGNVGITLAESQNPNSLTIDESCDILVAKEADYLADEEGNVVVDGLYFKRMFSVVKIALNGPASLNGEKVQEFSLTAPEGTILTGRAAIDLSTATIEKWNIKNNIVTATYTTDAPTFGDATSSGNVVWLVVNPCTITSGEKVVLAGETAGYTFSKEVTLSKDLVFPQSQLAVINLTLAEENCTKKVAASWIATDLADITATDEVVITMAKDGSVYAMTSEKGTSAAPTAVAVTVENNELTDAPADNLVWNIANDKGNLTIYPKGQTATWLYTTGANNGVRVGTNDNKTFIVDSDYGYLKNTATNRYLGVYNNADWRCYDNMHANIAGQTLCFYVKGTPKTALETPANLAVSAAKVVSWDAVSGAASYEITIGKDVFTSETNSYDATTVVDDYYDVAVVAVPTDKENYKNSAAATLSGVKFGIPTLATPTLKEGVVDGASISVSWSVDERATAGYNCELFKGEVKVGESQIVKAGTVTFTGLDAETAYVVKVNAIAVEGAKAYAASPVATLDVTTKAASATANDGSLERPYTAAEAIAAIDANTGLIGKYVKGIVKATPSFNATYKSLTYDIVSGEATLYIYSGRDLGDADFVGAEDLKAGDEVIVFGTLKKYNTTYELDKENYLISINGKTELYRGLAVSGQKTAFNVGDAFEFGGKALQVWRGKEDVDVTTSATFRGYDMSTEGKQTVTVTVGGESVTYEITVNPAGTVLEKSEPITLANGQFVGGENPTITWSGTSCSFVQTQGTSTAKVANYTSDPRWYKSHVISFKANTGFKITKVVVTCVNGERDNYKYVNALKNSTYSPKETTSATASDTEVTITTAGDFTITMGAQSRISSVVVYYTD